MRKEKQLLKHEVVNHLGVSSENVPFVVMQYSRLSANVANQLRRELNKSGGTIEVIKKRLLFKAIQEVGISLDPASFPGHLGIVFLGPEPLEMTKYLMKFGKDQDGVVQVVCGRFDGQFYDGKQVEQLSKLPSKEEMRAQLLATLEAPLSQTLAVFEALLTSLPHCLNNKTQQE